MTEYDYSPEAYEKYLATQARIANWVDETNRHKLVGADVPPTPLGNDTNAPLPYHKERIYRSPEPSKSSRHYYPTPSPGRTKQSTKKRSKSFSAPATGAPTPFVPTPENPAPGVPVYFLDDRPTASKRISTPSGNHPKRPDSAPSRKAPELTRAIDRSPSSDLETPFGMLAAPTSRKLSMSFAAPTTRPTPVHRQTAPPQPNVFYPELIPRDQSSYYSSQNSSPNYPYSSTAYLPQPPAPAPKTSYPTQNFAYPLPHQQYPNYDAVRRREPIRANTAPAHAPHYSTDNNPYPYSAPGYSYHSDQSSPYAYQPPAQPQPPPPPVQVPFTFPNGKQIYVTPSKSNKLDYSRMAEMPKVPFSYYETPKKQLPLLKRLFTGFGKGSDRSQSLKPSGTQSAQTSPTKKRIRKRRSSFNL